MDKFERLKEIQKEIVELEIKIYESKFLEEKHLKERCKYESIVQGLTKEAWDTFQELFVGKG